MAVDHLNIVERKLIDNLRSGTYNTTAGTSTAWSSSDVTVFGQFPILKTSWPCRDFLRLEHGNPSFLALLSQLPKRMTS